MTNSNKNRQFCYEEAKEKVDVDKINIDIAYLSLPCKFSICYNLFGQTLLSLMGK